MHMWEEIGFSCDRIEYWNCKWFNFGGMWASILKRNVSYIINHFLNKLVRSRYLVNNDNVARCCVEILRAFEWSWPAGCCWYEISIVANTGNWRGKGNDRILNCMATTNYIGSVAQTNTRFRKWLFNLSGWWVAGINQPFPSLRCTFSFHHSISWQLSFPCYKQLSTWICFVIWKISILLMNVWKCHW